MGILPGLDGLFIGPCHYALNCGRIWVEITLFLMFCRIVSRVGRKCPSQNNFHSFEGIEVSYRSYFDLVLTENGPYFQMIDRTSEISGFVEELRPA